MKNSSRGLGNRSQWSITTCLLCLAGSVSGATFSVSPSTISNTDSGIITLTVGGLTNGETVVVQKFIDAKTNLSDFSAFIQDNQATNK